VKEFNELGEPVEAPKKKKWGFFSSYTKDGKGVKKEDIITNYNFINFFKLYARRFSKLVWVNALYIVGNFPLIFLMIALSNYFSDIGTSPASELYAVLNSIGTASGGVGSLPAALLGIHVKDAAQALATATVNGRFERVHTPIPGVTFVIDYAHNGESLSSALRALRAYQPARLICLFGSVGGRTEVRRRELGIAAAEYADFSILTDDNPDRESSADIISDIEKHMNGAPRIAIPNRKEAIEYAVSIAREGDIVLFAGKDHENYQLINGKKLPFSEKECILSAAEKLGVTKF
jgi:hypothetical protein